LCTNSKKKKKKQRHLTHLQVFGVWEEKKTAATSKDHKRTESYKEPSFYESKKANRQLREEIDDLGNFIDDVSQVPEVPEVPVKGFRLGCGGGRRLNHKGMNKVVWGISLGEDGLASVDFWGSYN
jgi:hypothetical protein